MKKIIYLLVLVLCLGLVSASEINCPSDAYVTWSTMQFIRDIDENKMCHDLGSEISGSEYRDEFFIWDSVYQVYEFDFTDRNKVNWIFNMNVSYVDSYVTFLIQVSKGDYWEEVEVRQLQYNGNHYNIQKFMNDLTPYLTDEVMTFRVRGVGGSTMKLEVNKVYMSKGNFSMVGDEVFLPYINKKNKTSGANQVVKAFCSYKIGDLIVEAEGMVNNTCPQKPILYTLQSHSDVFTGRIDYALFEYDVIKEEWLNPVHLDSEDLIYEYHIMKNEPPEWQIDLIKDELIDKFRNWLRNSFGWFC